MFLLRWYSNWATPHIETWTHSPWFGRGLKSFSFNWNHSPGPRTYWSSAFFVSSQKEFSVWQSGGQRVSLLSWGAFERYKGQARECRPKNRQGCIFIIKEKVGRGEDHLHFHFWVGVKAYIISFPFDSMQSHWDSHEIFKSYINKGVVINTKIWQFIPSFSTMLPFT